jgi:hypothetical protein
MRGKNRAWLWLFLLLFVASVVVAVTMIRFNLGLQLTAEDLAAARARWKEKGPRDYRMVYTKQLGDDPRKDRFVVEVRGGQVRSVIMNQTTYLDADKLGYHSMDRLFYDITLSMEQDEKERRKVYVRAAFNPVTGAIQEYIRRVTGKRERVQLQVLELEQMPPAGTTGTP